MEKIGAHGRDGRRTAAGVVRTMLGLMAGVAVCLSTVAHGQFRQRMTVIENARVHTGETWRDDTTIVISGSRIAQVAPAGSVQTPNNAERIDGSGLSITPGLIDVGSALGMTGSGGGATGIAFDAFDRYDSRSFVDTLRQGVTSAVLVPAVNSGIGPQCSLVRLERVGDDAFGAVSDGYSAMTINLASQASAVDRLRILEDVHRSFREAEDHREAMEEYEEDLAEYKRKLDERRERKESDDSDAAEEGDGDDSAAMQNPRRRPRQRENDGSGSEQKQQKGEDDEEELEKPEEPDRNPTAEVLIKAMDGELTVRVRADRDADLLNALELAERFQLDLVLEGGWEAHRIAEQIAEADVPLILDVGRPWTEHPDDIDALGILDDAGVQWTLASGPADSRAPRLLFMRAAMLASGTAASFDPVARVTGDAAALLGMEDRLGRIERGASADIVLWDGDPTHAASRVERVLIKGRPVYRADDDIELTGDRP